MKNILERGEIFGLLGPNGAGKSTTFKMMCGLLTPTEGGCSVSGLDFRTAPGAARAKLGYIAQKFSLYESFTGRDWFASGAALTCAAVGLFWQARLGWSGGGMF